MASSRSRIERSLRTFSVRSYLFQCRVATELELHPTDLQALHEVGMQGGLSAGELARRLGLTSGATTTLIGRLERRGWVRRTPSSEDRRRVIVEIDESNRPDLRLPYRNIDQRVRRILGRRGPAELEVIADFLAELVEPAPPG